MPETFRFDLSVLSAPECRTTQTGVTDPNITDQGTEEPCVENIGKGTTEQEQKRMSGKSPSSPDRTAATERTQSSSNSSVRNTTCTETDVSRECGSQPTKAAGEEAVEQPPCIHRVASNESIGKKSSSFSSVGKNVSAVGKNVLKSLRRNMSLMTSMSFDSGSTRSSWRSKSKKKRRKSSPSIMPRGVNVSVIEGEGVEVTTKVSDCLQEDEGSSSSISDEILDAPIPKVIRDTSTFATKSLTSDEESSNAENCEDDADIRKLCSLMDKIRSDDEYDDANQSFSSVSSLADFQEGPAKNAPVKHGIDASPLQPDDDNDVFDLMIFVNNEQMVLEYAPDEFQRLDSN